MQEHFDTVGGTAPSDTELVRRIRAAARPGGRPPADPSGAPAPGSAAEEALNEFHRRHYAAVLAYARDCCRSSQAAADLAAEAIAGVLHSPGPGEGPDAAWRDALLTAVRHTADAWHHSSRRTELHDDFPSWLAAQPGEGPGSSEAGGTSASTDGDRTAAVWPVGSAPSAEERRDRPSRLSPARLVVLAVAVAALAGAAISVGPLLGRGDHDDSTARTARSGLPSAPTPNQPPTASRSSSASASSSASSTPDATRTPASKRPSPRPSSPKKSSRPTHQGPKSRPSPARTTPLSARPFISSANGWGQVMVDRSTYGNPLSIQGVQYPDGLGVHASSEVTYQLDGSCSALGVDVGIDDEVGANGSVVFQIFRDGSKAADSGLVTVGQPAQRLTADLTGATTLRLVVTDGGNGNNSDHAVWGAPRITCR
ncbi:NPCBM/NEW2 domain-containing protein [Streptomyces sp. NPDC020742]|uniref:NPCBM/NEW2 domain-containing protein n=1 Tax=Streptomyces sp. NPDC020742 TaxID=3154897 RepID=UPI0033F89754